MVNIAVDTSGGDFGPIKTVYGACLAMDENPDLSCLFFGSPEQIEEAIPDFADRSRIDIIAAEERITDEDNPLTAVRKKKDSPIVKGLQAVARGQADSFISAGNSGAIYAGGLSIIGKIPTLKRPSAVSILPTVSASTPYYLLIDSGANITSKPEHLPTYGRLGGKIAQQLLGIENPRVGLLNIGTEASKGDAFTKEAYSLLVEEKEINFTGNVEPSVLLHGTHDVVLTDGFTGNIMLKTMEGAAAILLNELLQAIKREVNLNDVSGEAIEQLIQARIKRYTNEDIGGGFILGIQAPVVITHGNANEVMFKNSLEIARKLAKSSIFSLG